MTSRRSQRTVLMGDFEREEAGDAVEFKLTYEGPLKVSGGAEGRPDHKHAIRRQFHPQLRRLWEITPHLKLMVDPPMQLVEVNRKEFRPRTETLAEKFSRGKYRFVPLVTRDLRVSACELDILFLRTDMPGAILKSGDIDGRLKTLFDALRIPSNNDEMGKATEPQEGEDPFYCLLEDDDLITKVTVETDVLLEPLKPGAFETHDARLVIALRIEPNIARLDLRFGTINFGG